MPTIYKTKKSKKYQTDIWISNRKFSRSTGCTSREDAEKRAVEIERDLRDQIQREADANTALDLDSVAGRYMLHVGDHHAGADNTRRLVAWLVDHFGGDKYFPSITHDEALAMRNALRRKKVGKGKNGQPSKNARAISNATVNDYVEQLKKLYTYLKSNGAKLENEPDWEKLWLAEKAEHVRYLIGDEEDRLYAAILERPDYLPLISFLHMSGKRKTNALTLPWDADGPDAPGVNWKREEITIIVKYPDGGRVKRFKITPALRAVLWPLYEARHDNCGVPEAAERVFTFVAERTVDKVIKGKRQTFVKGKRYPITKDSLRQVWNTIRARAGLTGADRLRLYDLRHDFATKLLASVPKADGVRIVQDALDHAPGSTMWMKYAHAMEGTTADAVEALAQKRLQRRMRSDAADRKSAGKTTGKTTGSRVAG